MWVLVNAETGLFVAREGSDAAYTDRLQDARVFCGQVQAIKNSCVGNERAVKVETIMMRRK